MRLLPLLLLFALAAQAQPLRHYTHFTEKDGLSDNNVRCILRDRQGYLWIGTPNGLNRYDGYSFRQYHPDARQARRTVSSEVINDIKQDGAGNIWLATANGLNGYDPRTESFKVWKNTGRHDGSLPNSLIWSILIDKDDQLWLACDNRDLCRFDPETERFTTYPWKAFLEKIRPEAARSDYQTIFNALPRSDGSLWLQTNFGLFSFDPVAQKFDYCPTPAKGYPKVGLIESLSTAPTGALNCQFLEKNGIVWLGSEHGLWLFDPAAQHFGHTQLKSARTNDLDNAYCRILDSKLDGRRYITDRYGGKLLVFDKGGRLLKSIVQPGYCGILHEDSAGQLWSSYGKKLYKIDRKSLTTKPFHVPSHLLDPLVRSHFYSMAEDSEGNLWFGSTDEGVLVWQPRTGEWWKPGERDGFIGRAVADLLADVERRSVWIATEDYGLFRFDEKTRGFTLYQPDENDLRHSLGAYIVKGLCKDGQGHIWVATAPGGISRFDYGARAGQQFTTLNSEDGLPSNQVNSLVTDAHGNVWAGTSKGLAWVDARQLRVRAFGKNDGMVTDFLDQPLVLAANGAVLNGTVSGYQTFHPDSLLKERQAPGILLTAFRIFDKNYSDSLNINYLQKINLSWRQNFFSFDFASVDFSQAQKNEYAYRLTNYDTGWNYLKNRHSASYTGVPPGDYQLEIRSGREGRWQEPGVRLGIHISPPFWATWWFRALVLCALTAVVWGLYRWRIAQIKREEALKTEFNQRIARTEMAALRAQMNPHFVFNCLSSINRFILVNQPEEASAYLTKFSRLIRLILDNSRTDTVPLNKELDALQLYVEMEQMRFNDRFEYRLTVADEVQTEHLEIPPLLIQPYVENAIWHGLMHKKTPGLLQLRVNSAGNKLIIEVEDNGIGRQRAMELKSRSATVNKSHGMKVTAERLEVINQLYGTHAVVSTEDLTGANGEATGTKVILELPENPKA